LDVGLEMVRAGWADIWFLSDFQRSSGYLSAAAEAERSREGVWGRCDGDSHFNHAAALRQRRRSAVSFIRRYYRRLSSNRFATAWGMLSRHVRSELCPFASWKAGYRRSLRTTVASARGRLSGLQAVVTASLRAYDRDACNGRVVRQYFRVRWTLAPRRSSWVALRVEARKRAEVGPASLRRSVPGSTIVAEGVAAVEAAHAARRAIAPVSGRGRMWIAGAGQVTVRATSTGQSGSPEAIPTSSTATTMASAASKKLCQNSS
jgi:hypothetical protein